MRHSDLVIPSCLLRAIAFLGRNRGLFSRDVFEQFGSNGVQQLCLGLFLPSETANGWNAKPQADGGFLWISQGGARQPQ